MNIYKKIFNNWQSYSNQTLEWFSTDTKENYENNLKNNYTQLQSLNWLDTNISYTFNSEGFRCHEFKEDSILFLGCSITQGIGMPLENIFPTLVSNQLKLNCINMGIERSSANTAFRLAQHFLKSLKPKIVVTVLIYPHRYELLTMDKAIHLIPNHKFQNKDSYTSLYYTDFYESWILQPENSLLNYNKNILAINQLCDDLNIKFVNFTSYVDQQKATTMMQESPSKARDLIHPGEDTHRSISKILLEHM